MRLPIENIFPSLPLIKFLELKTNDAKLLYLALREASDESGYCSAIVYIASIIGIYQDRGRAAIEELESVGLIRTLKTENIYGTQTDCVLLGGSLPRRLDRISPDAWARLRAQVFERDNYTCFYCGISGVSLECDHIEPLSKGGTNELGNLITACSRCNQSKRAKTLAEWRGRQCIISTDSV